MALTGTGFDFTVTFSDTSSTTIASGQTAEYTLVITPLNGSQGAFTLQCGMLPSHATCAFNPNGESITANTTGNVEVAIATGVSSTSAQIARHPWSLWPLACGLALVPFALFRRRRALLLMALLAVLVSGVTSCASSGPWAAGRRAAEAEAEAPELPRQGIIRFW